MKRKCVSYHVKCATVDTVSHPEVLDGRSLQEVCPEVTPEETTFVAQLRFVTLEMAGAGVKIKLKRLVASFHFRHYMLENEMN